MASPRRFALLALTGALRPCAAEGPLPDGLSLVQAPLAAAAASEDCDCVGWKTAYSSLGAKCGQGHELDLALPLPGVFAAMNPQLQYEFCKFYFSGLPDDAFCQREKFGNGPEHWCYVSDKCPTATMAGSAKVKSCRRGRDRHLGDMKFEEFAKYAHGNKLEMGLMVQFAYPTYAGEKLPDVQAFWGLPAPADAKPMSDELRKHLQAVVDSGETTFFTSRNGHPPFGVAEGSKFYYINFDPHKYGFDRKEDMNKWACVAGCTENSPLW